MHLLSLIIYSSKTLYMFWTVFPSNIRSSKLRIQQRYMSNSCCYLLLSGMRWNWLKTYTLAAYAVLSSWWWTERPSETCRAFYKNKWYEITGASCWLYYRNDNSKYVLIAQASNWIRFLTFPKKKRGKVFLHNFGVNPLQDTMSKSRSLQYK